MKDRGSILSFKHFKLSCLSLALLFLIYSLIFSLPSQANSINWCQGVYNKNLQFQKTTDVQTNKNRPAIQLKTIFSKSYADDIQPQIQEHLNPVFYTKGSIVDKNQNKITANGNYLLVIDAYGNSYFSFLPVTEIRNNIFYKISTGNFAFIGEVYLNNGEIQEIKRKIKIPNPKYVYNPNLKSNGQYPYLKNKYSVYHLIQALESLQNQGHSIDKIVLDSGGEGVLALDYLPVIKRLQKLRGLFLTLDIENVDPKKLSELIDLAQTMYQQKYLGEKEIFENELERWRLDPYLNGKAQLVIEYLKLHLI